MPLTLVRGFLLGILGDPRVGTGWRDVEPLCAAVMLKWLAAISLKAFFELIAEFANDHQFKYRRAFWSAYIDAKVVDEAWLALGANIHYSARAIKELNGAYGRVSGPGVSGNQAMLLLRIGDVIFCEWSDNGKLRAWRRDWKNAPSFGRIRGEYTKDEVNGRGLPFPPNPRFGKGGAADGQGLSHINPPDGYWQGSAAELIARQTGIRLTTNDWMPK